MNRRLLASSLLFAGCELIVDPHTTPHETVHAWRFSDSIVGWTAKEQGVFQQGSLRRDTGGSMEVTVPSDVIDRVYEVETLLEMGHRNLENTCLCASHKSSRVSNSNAGVSANLFVKSEEGNRRYAEDTDSTEAFTRRCLPLGLTPSNVCPQDKTPKVMDLEVFNKVQNLGIQIFVGGVPNGSPFTVTIDDVTVERFP